MTSKNYVKGIITIHTTSDINSPHIDYDDIKNLNIHEVENYGATGTVQLVNNYPIQTKNLLSNYCDLWSDHVARKLDRAMFLRIYHDSRTSANAIGVYLITQINASDGLITLTFCDSVQYLRSVGVDYVRNHASSQASWHTSETVWENNEARVRHPSGVVLHGGSYHDIVMAKMHRTTFNDENKTIGHYGGYSGNDYVTSTIPLGRTVNRIHKITIKNIMANGLDKEFDVSTTIAISVVGTMTRQYMFNIHCEPNSTSRKSYTFDFTTNPIVATTSSVTFKIKFNREPSGKPAPPPAHIDFHFQENVSGASTTYTLNYIKDKTETGWAFDCDIIASYDTDNITGTNANDYFKVETMDGETPTQESIETINYPGRTKTLYIDPSSRIGGNVVFQHIVKVADFSADEFQGMRDLHVFRCNGDYLHNYLLALADMPNSDGRQFAFRSSTTVWNHLNTGFRFKKTDQTFVYFYYAYFGVIEGGQAMMSFNPSISMKNHPRLAVVKGSTEEKKPIMVALMDPNVPIGASIPSVNSSVTNAVEGTLATYSDIITNRSDEWQGEIKVSGIHLDYFGRGSVVGGVPISITDHRYGFADYKAKVKEITWDFANQTTTITVNNYSEMYSNAILDTSKMAYSAGDMSAESTNVDMFLRQFVNIDATSMTSDGATNNITMIVYHGVEATITDATTIDLPELNVRVVNGYFPPGTGHAMSQYGVHAVKVGNRTHEIPTPRCPDKQENQSLIVNVIYKLK